MKYSPKCIEQFPYNPLPCRVLQDFYKPPLSPPKRYFPTFYHRTCSFCCFPIFSVLELFQDPSKDKPNFNRFWKASSWVTFSTSNQIPLFGHSRTFFPHRNFPPKDTCSLKRPWWSSLNGIRASTGLLINNFFFWWSSHFLPFEPPNKNLPKVYL